MPGEDSQPSGCCACFMSNHRTVGHMPAKNRLGFRKDQGCLLHTAVRHSHKFYVSFFLFYLHIERMNRTIHAYAPGAFRSRTATACSPGTVCFFVTDRKENASGFQRTFRLLDAYVMEQGQRAPVAFVHPPAERSESELLCTTHWLDKQQLFYVQTCTFRSPLFDPSRAASAHQRTHIHPHYVILYYTASSGG